MEKNNVRASVAMAVYNGEKFIREQIDSIINMLGNKDELIISYDESIDSTLVIIKEYEKKDSRIKVVYDDGHSVESNFNNAVNHCSGEYIFLSDQDDVWINDKINVLIKYFENNEECVVVISDGYIVDEKLNIEGSVFEVYNTSSNPLRNFVKGSYLGCQMAFRSCIKSKVWPVKVSPPLPHDLWLGVCGARYGKIGLVKEKLIMHRLHDCNYSNTSKMSLNKVIENRLLFLFELHRRR